MGTLDRLPNELRCYLDKIHADATPNTAKHVDLATWVDRNRKDILIALAGSDYSQSLVARIKRSSKYYGQTERGAWFDVRVVADGGYSLRGNSNNYRLSDVVLGMRLEGGAVINLATGKTEG